MADDSDNWYGSIIDRLGGVNGSLPGGESEQNADGRSGGLSLTRRSYLAGAGTAAVALAGCAGQTTESVVQPLTVFGYGGGTVIQQSESLSMSVTESEPNDTRQAAMGIGLGTTIDGDLTQYDSDWYAFDVSSGEQLVVTFRRSSPTGVTAVIVYDTDGVFSNLRYVSTDGEVAFGVDAETGGTHYVQVVDTQSSDGPYTLKVGRTSGTGTPTTTETPTTTDTPTTTETPTVTETPTTTEPGTATPTSTATPIEDDYGEQGYGDFGYGGVEV